MSAIESSKEDAGRDVVPGVNLNLKDTVDDASTVASLPYPPSNVDPEIAAINNEALTESLKESSSHARGLLSLFILAIFYVSVITFSTSHMQLLVNNGTVHLPVLSVGIPLKTFYIVAPLFVVAFHLYLLIELSLHARKAQEWNRRRTPKQSRRLFFPFLFNYSSHGVLPQNPAGRMLLLLITWLLVYAAPLVVLFLMAIRYLPTHDPVITMLHRVLIPFDFILLFVYWRGIRDPYWEEKITGGESPKGLSHIQSLQRRLHNYVRALPKRWIDLVFAFGITLAVIRIIDIPRTNYEVLIPGLISVEINSLVQRNIDLQGKTITQSPPSEAIMQTYVSMNKSRDSAWIEFSEGIDLTGRDLRFANFSGARLINANFRGARLDSANLTNATLLSTNFHETGLNGARFDSATLSGARFCSTFARGTRFDDASFEGVVLVSSDLTRAKLPRAKILCSYISNSDFTEAEMYRTNLEESTILESIFIRTRLAGGTMRGSIIEGSTFDDAFLVGTHATGSTILASSFVGAKLQNFDLSCGQLWFVNYANADLSGALFNGASLRNVLMVDASTIATVFDGASFLNCSFHGVKDYGLVFTSILIEETAKEAFFFSSKVDWRMIDPDAYRDIISHMRKRVEKYNNDLSSAIQDTATAFQSPLLLAAISDRDGVMTIRKELACSNPWAAYGLFRFHQSRFPDPRSKGEVEIFDFLTQSCPSMIDSVRNIQRRRAELDLRLARLRIGAR